MPHKKILFLIVLILSCLPQTSSADNNTVIIAFEAERKGNFLSEPGNVPLEFLRRAGRAINKIWPAQEEKLIAASVFNPSQIGNHRFLKPLKSAELSPEQRKTARQLLDRYGSDALNLIENFPIEERYIIVRFVSEMKPVAEMLENIIGSDALNGKLKPEQLTRIQTQLLPVVKASECLIGAVVLSEQGFESKLRIISNGEELISPDAMRSLSITDYIRPEALMVFAQTHPIGESAKLLQTLKSAPQTAALQSMIASAGLDLEKDLIANHARESILYVNFEPDIETGIPDIRFVAPVPDVKKLQSNLPKLKKLCTQLGVFVKIPVENESIAHLSYFMFPQYGVYAGLADRFVVLASRLENLKNEMSFIEKVNKKEIETEKVETGIQKYWLIKFDDFNLQLQKFLQSPFMSSKGIPPIPNLNLLDDLVHLKLTQRMDSKKIDFSLQIPIKKSRQN